MTARTTPGKGLTITLWTLQILVAAAFLFAGGAKLVGGPQMVAAFDKIGVGQWFRSGAGGCEQASQCAGGDDADRGQGGFPTKQC